MTHAQVARITKALVLLELEEIQLYLLVAVLLEILGQPNSKSRENLV
jgi:hypothetical protein